MTSNSARRDLYLNEMGLGPVWRQRPVLGDQQSTLESNPASAPESCAAAPSPADIASMDWGQLEAAVAGCSACGLCRSRSRTVFGSGQRKGGWLFIGAGPGKLEEEQGQPFAGASGKLLDNMLAALSLARGNAAYLTTVVKCRATDGAGNDRAPSRAEAAACRPFLARQIALLQPVMIVALGKVAAFSLLDQDDQENQENIDPAISFTALRGTLHHYDAGNGAAIPLVVSYHPDTLLLRPAEKKNAWADLCLALQAYAESAGSVESTGPA